MSLQMLLNAETRSQPSQEPTATLSPTKRILFLVVFRNNRPLLRIFHITWHPVRRNRKDLKFKISLLLPKETTKGSAHDQNQANDQTQPETNEEKGLIYLLTMIPTLLILLKSNGLASSTSLPRYVGLKSHHLTKTTLCHPCTGSGLNSNSQLTELRSRPSSRRGKISSFNVNV